MNIFCATINLKSVAKIVIEIFDNKPAGIVIVAVIFDRHAKSDG
jgi:hypothetical protein